MNTNTTQTTTHDFDPAQLNDPLANKIDWSPLQKSEQGLQTYNLSEKNPDRLEFKLDSSLKLYISQFLFFGLPAIILPPLVNIIGGTPIWAGWKTLALLLFGLAYTAAGVSMYYHVAAPIVFDKRIGYFFKGWKSPHQALNNDSIKTCAEFADIHALQIVSVPCTIINKTFLRYELNIVLKNAARLNVVSINDNEKLNQVTQKLADFLNVPIWDAAH